MSRSQQHETTEQHASQDDSGHRSSGESGHSGEGAASAMAQMISQDQQRHQGSNAEDAAGGRAQ